MSADVRKLRNDNRLRHFGLLPDFDDERDPGPPGGRHPDDSGDDDDEDDDDEEDAPYLPRIPYDRLPLSRHRSGRLPPHRPLPNAADNDDDDEMFPIRKRYYVPSVSCDKSSGHAGPGGVGNILSHNGQPKLRRAPRIIRRRSLPGDAVDGRVRPPSASHPDAKPFRPGPPNVGGDEYSRQTDDEHNAADRRRDKDGERVKGMESVFCWQVRLTCRV